MVRRLQPVGIEILVYNGPLVEDRERSASEITRKSCFCSYFASSCSARTRVTSTVSIHHEQLTGILRRVVTAWPSYYATFFRSCSPRALLCVQKPAIQVPQEDCGAERLTLVD